MACMEKLNVINSQIGRSPAWISVSNTNNDEAESMNIKLFIRSNSLQ